ncbi:Predicted integral membrane protein [Moraxella caprae]|uniref:Predicted integral membrane protein n=2 Tax=Moraxella caprae TaxID=90240 RepID=A0A378QWU3_9GAMM|nr:Predicted integral membrane protein [Moraxella caprae]
MMTKISVKWLWFAVLLWFGLSCYGLFLRVPSGQVPSVSHLDKVAHFAMFFGQFYLLSLLFNINTKTKALYLWAVALGWAVASELIQGYFTTRTMDVWDGVADMVGASLAVGWRYLWQRGCFKGIVN